MKNFEGFMRKFAKQNHVEVQWQQLRFGYKRAKIPCHSWAEYTAVEAALRRNKSLRVDYCVCFDGEFEAYLYVMPLEDYTQLKAKSKVEQDKLDDWWQRYHNADAETRRLMACGAIE